MWLDLRQFMKMGLGDACFDTRTLKAMHAHKHFSSKFVENVYFKKKSMHGFQILFAPIVPMFSQPLSMD